MHSNSLKEEIIYKGYLHQCTHSSELFELLQNGQITFYVGFDCTAQSLHIGNLLTIMLVRLLQSYGNKPIILLGGGTSKIGDPSGKTKARPVLETEEIQKNFDGILRSLSKFIKFGDKENEALLINNADWLEKLNHLDFLRTYGKHVSISQALSLDFIKSRLSTNQHLSLLEFSYSILQSFDFLYLYQNYGCRLQIGGSDQWGNIISGIDLTHKVTQAKVYGLTVPLLTTASGAKMGKSESGAVWLNADQMSAYEYFQYWRNIDDRDIVRFAKLYSELSKTEIEALEKVGVQDINSAKEQLAFRLTLLCHGQDAAQAAVATSKNAFSEDTNVEGLPKISIDSARLKMGIFVHEILVLSKMIESSSEAKRLILAGAIKITNRKISTPQDKIFLQDLEKDGSLKITIGKKKHFVLHSKK